MFYLRYEFKLSTQDIMDLTIYEMNYLMDELGFYYQEKNGKKVNRKHEQMTNAQLGAYLRANGLLKETK